MVKIRKRRLFIWIVVIIIGCILAGTAYWWFMVRPVVPDTVTKGLGDSAAAQVNREKVAQEYVTKKDSEGGLSYYHQLLENTEDTTNQQALLLEAAWFAIAVKEYDKALDLANQAEAIHKDTGTILCKAQVYELTGDKKAAIAQYNQALATVSSDETDYSARTSYKWKLKIEELSQ